MARYILIDNCSGYIWGDSADLEGKIFNGTPVEYAKALDAHIDNSNNGRIYDETSRHALASNETGYHVFRADVDGSEAIPVVHDGQDRDTIRAVWDICEYVTTIRCIDAEG